VGAWRCLSCKCLRVLVPAPTWERMAKEPMPAAKKEKLSLVQWNLALNTYCTGTPGVPGEQELQT